MTNRRGILIASASAGTGHLQAAEALRAALLLRDPALHVEHVDVLERAPSWLRAAYRGGFELLAARAPRVWQEIYERTDGPGADPALWSDVAHRVMFHEFRRTVLSGRWDLVLCTHFLPAQLMSLRQGAPPFAMAVTDFTLHRYWAQPRVGRYFAATPSIASELRRRVRSARVSVTGIPVRPDLVNGPYRAQAVQALDLDPGSPVVLVMGGGLGLGVGALVESAVAALNGSRGTILALCGRNDDARRALADRPGVRALGYIDDVRPHLAAADVVVTKPGGLSTSEALALGRPMVLSPGIPGHEEGNRRYLVDAGAALAGHSPGQLADAVRRLVGDGALRLRMSSAARRIGRPHSADAVAATVQREYLLRNVA